MELPESDPAKIAYPIDEAGRLIGCGPRRVRELVDRGQLPAKKLGNQTLILRDDLVEFARGLPPHATKKTS